MREQDISRCLPWRKKRNTITFQSEKFRVEEVLRGQVIVPGSGFRGSPPVKRGIARVHLSNVRAPDAKVDFELNERDIFVGDTLEVDLIYKMMETCGAVIAEKHDMLSHIATIIEEKAESR